MNRKILISAVIASLISTGCSSASYYKDHQHEVRDGIDISLNASPIQVCNKLYDYSITKHDYSLSELDEEFDSHKIKNRNLRENAISSEAMRKGSNTGLYYRYRHYVKELEKPENQKAMDQAYNFRVLSYDYMLMPPVITKAGASVEVQNAGMKATTTDLEWEIVKDAKMVTTPPTWRNYLLRYGKGIDHSPVTAALLPRNSREKQIWRAGMCRGVAEGFRQADRAFKFAFAELNRDFLGMLLFRKLHLQGIVSKPIVRSAEKGTVTDGKIMWVNKEVHSISSPVSFKMPDDWKLPTISINGEFLIDGER